MCSWAPVDLGTDAGFVRHGPPPYASGEVLAPPEWNRVERCQRGDFESEPASASALGALELHRIGPFTTQGGKDWTSTNLVNNSYLGESWKWPAISDQRVLGVREYFLGAYDGASSLLGYPPIHQHHFHVESRSWFPVQGAMITHGDDQCVHEEGGINCDIRRMPTGYALPMHLPLPVFFDQQDVRAVGSANFTWYALIAVRGFPWQRSSSPFQSLTQVRLNAPPITCLSGEFYTYLVAADQISAFWREGAFNFTAPLVYSYFHTHPSWTEEMRFYTGASAAQIGMDSVGMPACN